MPQHCVDFGLFKFPASVQVIILKVTPDLFIHMLLWARWKSTRVVLAPLNICDPQGWASSMVRGIFPLHLSDRFCASIWSFSTNLYKASFPSNQWCFLMENWRVKFIWPILDVPFGLKRAFPAALASESFAITSVIPKFTSTDETPGLPTSPEPPAYPFLQHILGEFCLVLFSRKPGLKNHLKSRSSSESI